LAGGSGWSTGCECLVAAGRNCGCRSWPSKGPCPSSSCTVRGETEACRRVWRDELGMPSLNFSASLVSFPEALTTVSRGGFTWLAGDPVWLHDAVADKLGASYCGFGVPMFAAGRSFPGKTRVFSFSAVLFTASGEPWRGFAGLLSCSEGLRRCFAAPFSAAKGPRSCENGLRRRFAVPRRRSAGLLDPFAGLLRRSAVLLKESKAPSRRPSLPTMFGKVRR
jgi:hypothetical protein